MARARRAGRWSVWFGLGMFGLVGWAVAIPALLGVALGVWLDGRVPGRRSWTLTLLLVGLALGCVNAWYWVKRESGRE
jgi:ATP synthase protein I